jgi:hypothetical protein
MKDNVALTVRVRNVVGNCMQRIAGIEQASLAPNQDDPWILHADDQLDTDKDLERFVTAIREGSGESKRTGAKGLRVEKWFEPAALIEYLESGDARPMPAVAILDIATQSAGRQINGEIDGGYAVARALIKRWPGVKLIFLSHYPNAGDANAAAADFDGYLEYLWKRGPRAADCLAKAVRRACGFTGMVSTGRLTVDPVRRVAKWNGVPVPLSAREFRMVDCIVDCCATRKREMATYAEILSRMGPNVTDTKSVHISMCRAKGKISAVDGTAKLGPNDVFMAIDGDEHAGVDGGYTLTEY